MHSHHNGYLATQHPWEGCSQYLGAAGLLTCNLEERFLGIASSACQRSVAFLLAGTEAIRRGSSSVVSKSCSALSFLFLEAPSRAAKSDSSSRLMATVCHRAASSSLGLLPGCHSRYRPVSSLSSDRKK